MTELQSLFVIFVALVLLESAAWVPLDATVFRTARGRRLRLETPLEGLGTATHGLAVTPRSLLCGARFVVELWPVSFAEDGLVVGSLEARRVRGARRFAGPRLRWEELDPIRADGRSVRSGARRLWRASSAEQAQALARMLERVRQAKRPERPDVIDAILAETCAVSLARARLDDVRRRGRPLALVAAALALFSLVFVPVASRLVVDPRLPFVVAAGFLGFGLLAGALRARLERQVSGLDALERFPRWLETLTFPPAAIAAHDRALRGALAAHHPIAVLLADGTPTGDTAATLGAWLRDLAHPIEPVPAPEPEARAVENAFRARVRARVEAELALLGLSAAALEQARPAGVGEPDPTARWCPRCLNTYGVANSPDACTDCLGVALVGPG